MKFITREKIFIYSKTIVLFLLTVVWFFWWHQNNPSPDGYQNEYLHFGNAYDLWNALLERDFWHMRWFMYTGYWPFGFYILSWPTLSMFGVSKLSIVSSNLILLCLIIPILVRLSPAPQRDFLFPLLILSPGVFGSLVRYEPNFANVFCMVLGLWALQRSQKLAKRKWVLLWGLALGCGLMVDRLTLLFFLFPASIPLLWRAKRAQWKNWIGGVLVTFVCTFAYYREFFIRHSEEILSQVPVGELNAAGQSEELLNPIPVLYYPLVLMDSQAGPFIGFLMLLGLGSAIIRKKSSWDWVLLFSVVPALVFFTIVTKKQVFYTLPALVPLTLMAARWNRLTYIALLGGFLGWMSLGWGKGVVGTPWMPDAWVSPKHILARPPTFEQWPYEDMLRQIDGSPKEILVLSEDDRLYEGFVILRMREAFPRANVRGVVLDPIGSVEFIREIDLFLWVGDTSGTWPTEGGIQSELIADHYQIGDLPPVSKKVVSLQKDFVSVGVWPSEEVALHLFERKK